jgi:hypothetical protein
MSNEQIKQFAEKNNLTEAEATLVYGTGEEQEIARNFALLQEVKGGTGDQQNQSQSQTRANDPFVKAQELLNKADEMMRKGNIEQSIRLRRQAHGMK